MTHQAYWYDLRTDVVQPEHIHGRFIWFAFDHDGPCPLPAETLLQIETLSRGFSDDFQRILKVQRRGHRTHLVALVFYENGAPMDPARVNDERLKIDQIMAENRKADRSLLFGMEHYFCP